MGYGETIRALRKRADISQERLAPLVGVTLGAISQFEREIHCPRRNVAKALDDVLLAKGSILAACGYTDELNQLDGMRDQLREQAKALDNLSRQMKAVRVKTVGTHREQPLRNMGRRNRHSVSRANVLRYHDRYHDTA